jgi:peptide deformylase
MPVLEIRKYGDPILKQKAAPVTEFNDELKQLMGDMLETMYAANGLGLAATQVGVLKRVITIDTGTRESPKVLRLANPEILGYSKEKEDYEEGCLSFPGITEKIYRPAKVKVKAQDPDGRELVIEAEGLAAVALQHEIDHINGVVFINRMSPVKRIMLNKQLKELKESRKKETP